MKYWNEIVEDDFNENAVKKTIYKKYSIKYLKKDSTFYVQTPQPAGVWTNKFWNLAGKEIRALNVTSDLVDLELPMTVNGAE